MTTYYTITINRKQSQHHYDNLSDAVLALYAALLESNGIKKKIDQTKITHYYMNIQYNVFNIIDENGLVLVDDVQRIVLPTFFPEMTALDLLYRHKTRMPDTSGNSQKKHIKNSESNCVNSLASCKKTNDVGDFHTEPSYDEPTTHDEIPAPKIPPRILATNLTTDDETFELQKELSRNKRIEDTRNIEKYRIFLSDKLVYCKLKHDIESGRLDKDNMHPCFAIKYLIFSILETRGAILFEGISQPIPSDDLLDKLQSDSEYDIFTKMMETSVNVDDDEELSKPDVYVPHNYMYFSDIDKDQYAQKHNLTRQEFEEKCVNVLESEY